jgi:hypothetical protein
MPPAAVFLGFDDRTTMPSRPADAADADADAADADADADADATTTTTTTTTGGEKKKANNDE